MTTTYRDTAVATQRAKRGTGTIRERLPGVWEIRVVVGFDPVHARSVQRSVTVHGDAEFAERRRRELVDDYGASRVAFTTEAARLTVAELMARFFEAPHLWKPATVVSHRPVVRALVGDALGRRRLVTLTPGDVRAAIGRWQADGVSVPTVSSRWLVLRSAVSWAVAERVLRSNPLAGMRGPPRPEPRRHHTIGEVRQLLRTAEGNVLRTAAALAAEPESPGCRRLLFSAEQGLVLVRLAADSGARRGEMAVLRLGDLDRRVLTIERGLSCGVLGSTKSARTRQLTLGSTTTALINDHFSSWALRGQAPQADWLFAPNPTRQSYVTADSLSHKFRRLGKQAGVANPALHRLRHGVATHLVDEGKLLKAQARLGHRDPSTTLRHYSHCTPSTTKTSPTSSTSSSTTHDATRSPASLLPVAGGA
jgi:integrase